MTQSDPGARRGLDSAAGARALGLRRRASARLCATLLGATAAAAVACAPAPAAGSRVGPEADWTPADWQVLDAKVRWAVAERLDTLPLGEAIGRLALSFVGATYTPATLELPGPERLIVNLREFDCVTFVENVLALAWFARHDGVGALADPEAAKARYERYLVGLRYRGGVIDGYPSRLHYFSEWLADNARRGNLRLATPGSWTDPEPIRFMSTHPQSYRQLADQAVLAAIRAHEERLNAAGPRAYVPEGQIAAVAGAIATGDVIAATSTLPGLDVAHTGFAVWRDGRLFLVHAPLVGKVVEVSERPLADRILAIGTQDGIIVGRPLERAAAGPAGAAAR